MKAIIERHLEKLFIYIYFYMYNSYNKIKSKPMVLIERKKQLSNRERELICSKYDAGKTLKTISSELDVNYKTVFSVVKVYKASGRINSLPVRGHKTPILNQEHVDFIKNEIETDCSITLGLLKNDLALEKNIIASKSTIYRSIKAFNFSLKRVSIVPESRNTASCIASRFEFANYYLSLNEEDIIFWMKRVLIVQ